MAMFIEMNNKPNQYLTIYIGQKIPNNIWRITTSIQADGDELDAIYNKFSSIFQVKARVVTFVGETAKMIAANWN